VGHVGHPVENLKRYGVAEMTAHARSAESERVFIGCPRLL